MFDSVCTSHLDMFVGSLTGSDVDAVLESFPVHSLDSVQDVGQDMSDCYFDRLNTF